MTLRHIAPARRLIAALPAIVLAACADDTSATSGGSSTGAPSSSEATSDTPSDSSSAGSSSESGTTAESMSTTTTPGDSSSSSSESATADESTSVGSSSTDPSDTSDTNPGESSDTGVAPVCPVDELGPGLPETLFGNTFGDPDMFDGTCGGAGAPDSAYTFTAPADGTYTFDTQGSQLDTVLYVLDGECAGNEIACNDDGAGLQSALAVDLVADQTVTIVVDGNAPQGLPFSLRVQSGALVCPVGDLGSVVPSATDGNSSSGFDGDGGSCGGGTGRELAYLFTAPYTGSFTFDTFGAAFTTRIYVRDGVCGGTELGCGADGLLVDLVADQQVTVVVDSDGVGGAFTLNVAGLGGACPDVDLGSVIPQSVADSTVGDDNTSSSTCGGQFSPDDLYEFTAPVDGLYQFDTFGSDFDTVLYLRDGCGGSEIDCNDDYVDGETTSRVIEGLDAGQTVVLGVDGNGIGDYALNVDLVDCPDDTILGPLPLVVMGDTFGGIDKLDGSCGAGLDDDSPDLAYAFTAPADGTYTFDTLGSFFDSRVYAFDGAACNGVELGCSDSYQFDSGGALTLQLSAGQTITVVVDGNYGDSGQFTLNVGELGGSCPDGDLGAMVPTMVAGSTVGGDNASAGSCGGLIGNDASYTFTAPADDLYLFDASGSDFDVRVYLRDGGCNGAELDCAPEFFGNPRVFAQMVQGQTVVVTLDGDGAEGDFLLEVDAAPPGGDCCEAHPDVGCGVPSIQDCVCIDVGDSYCCDVQWDDLCVDEAINDCGAICP